MNILKRIKNNLFLVSVIIAYIVLFVVKPDIALTSIKNSGFYIKEMLLIMPVVFLLTALLDMWIPKDTIMKYLGTNSKMKGILLSFLMGSVSAGPIYSAFPICIMLLKKGASIRNIVIILSSWAVIKIPMLINEIKFLGFKFMAIRWVLTVIAIVIFSFITDKVVKKRDIPINAEDKKGIVLKQEYCMGCSMCTKIYPELFIMQGKKALIKTGVVDVDEDKILLACSSCPSKAIEYNKP